MSDESYLRAGFEAIEKDGWLQFDPLKLDNEHSGSLAERYDKARSKYEFIGRFARYIDRRMLDFSDLDYAEESPRERLFEIIMRRFDALGHFKPGLSRLAKEACFDPQFILVSKCGFRRASQWMLAFADPKARGLRKRVAENAIAAIYVRCLSVWIEDESEDSARTMAELDKRLGQAERLASLGRKRSASPDIENTEPHKN